MEDEWTLVHCPTCNRFIASTTADFVGAVSYWCRHCKAPFGSDEPDLPALRCPCGTRLHSGRVDAGTLRIYCRRCKTPALVWSRQPRPLKLVDTIEPVKVAKPKKSRWEAHEDDPVRRARLSDADFISMIEERWDGARIRAAQRRTEVAVGLRFDVLNRDGFRCTYCGRGVTQGALLEVDHIVPRSAGGPDILSNLRTACEACNRGKSAKPLREDDAIA